MLRATQVTNGPYVLELVRRRDADPHIHLQGSQRNFSPKFLANWMTFEKQSCQGTQHGASTRGQGVCLTGTWKCRTHFSRRGALDKYEAKGSMDAELELGRRFSAGCATIRYARQPHATARGNSANYVTNKVVLFLSRIGKKCALMPK